MKTLLNLLPEENKKNIQRKLHFRFFLWQLFLVCVLELFYVGILVSVFFILDFQLQGLQVSGRQYGATDMEQKTLALYQQKFKDTNASLDVIGKIEQNHFSFVQIFSLLEKLLPEGVAVDHLTTKNYTVMLSGRAATRDDMLTFESRLKESDCIKNVNVPLTNLFSQENIDFQIDFEMQKDCLQKNTL